MLGAGMDGAGLGAGAEGGAGVEGATVMLSVPVDVEAFLRTL